MNGDDLGAGNRSAGGHRDAGHRGPLAEDSGRVELHVLARLGRSVDRGPGQVRDICRVVGVIEVTMPDEERLRPQVDEVLDYQRRAASLHLQPGDEGIEENDTSLYRRRERGVSNPREDHLVVANAASPCVDIVLSKYFLACSDGCPRDMVAAVIIARDDDSAHAESGERSGA